MRQHNAVVIEGQAKDEDEALQKARTAVAKPRHNPQYACPHCDRAGHIRIDLAGPNNARCTLCGWIGSSLAASMAADDLAGMS